MSLWMTGPPKDSPASEYSAALWSSSLKIRLMDSKVSRWRETLLDFWTILWAAEGEDSGWRAPEKSLIREHRGSDERWPHRTASIEESSEKINHAIMVESLWLQNIRFMMIKICLIDKRTLFEQFPFLILFFYALFKPSIEFKDLQRGFLKSLVYKTQFSTFLILFWQNPEQCYHQVSRIKQKDTPQVQQSTSHWSWCNWKCFPGIKATQTSENIFSQFRKLGHSGKNRWIY